MTSPVTLSECLAEISRGLSAAGARQLAAAVRSAGAPETLARDDSLPNQQQRRFARQLAGSWERTAGVPAEAVALALETAQAAVSAERSGVGIDLVWTGPKSSAVPVAMNAEALHTLIKSAQRRLLVVSYATYHVPEVVRLLGEAVERGVEVDLVLEFQGSDESGPGWNSLKSLGGPIPAGIRVYHWPPEQRPKTPTGKMGYIHVKCAVADSEAAFISSANLTAYAMEMNMELGVVIHGGDVPARIAQHFARLIVEGVLQPWIATT
jgi:phosphatidylserine/phosphatidylglycerophosphate/cardiolipin synthase-like enzyme